jgi:hypothetical protein
MSILRGEKRRRSQSVILITRALTRERCSGVYLYTRLSRRATSFLAAPRNIRSDKSKNHTPSRKSRSDKVVKRERMVVSERDVQLTGRDAQMSEGDAQMSEGDAHMSEGRADGAQMSDYQLD